ncbi:MAG: HD domain-containing protein [Firmicutes bacterium]|nr:HD domain-containing protein [Bacillota bacterium]
MNTSKRLRDVIYGFIHLDKQECEIINRPEFQRLRRIKQLALTNMVYPGAMHTRFEHSLGVMQMASDMYDRILDNTDTETLEACGLHEEQQQKHYRKVVRLAALLHDIGHPPFSHAGEDLLPPLPKSNPPKHYKHEAYSVSIIQERFKGSIENPQYGKIKVEEVIALIDDKFVLRKNYTSGLLAQIISGQIDADRADYLLRDSYHAGVKYGVYDHKILVNSLRIAKQTDHIEGTESHHIVIDKSGIHAVESLLIARYQMFMQVYRHKVRCAYNFHLEKACREILLHVNKGIFKGVFPPPTKLDQYLLLDDIYMESRFREYGGYHGEIILNRNHWKQKYSSDDNPNSNEEISKLKEKYGEENIHIDTYSKPWYGGAKTILVYDKDKKLCKELHEKSNLIDALSKKTYSTRIFLNPEHNKD